MRDPNPTFPSSVPDHLRERISPELEDNERLIWAAHAEGITYQQRSKLRGQFLLATGLLSVSSVSCFLAFFVLKFPPGWLGLALVAIGFTAGAIGGLFFLAMILGAAAGLLVKVILGTILKLWPESWLAMRMRAVTVYALTDRRAIILRPLDATAEVEVGSYPTGSIEQTHRVESPDGSGDVEFVVAGPEAPPSGFFGIADVRRVEQLVRVTLIAP